MAPSIKTLEAAFPDKGRQLRKIIDGGVSCKLDEMEKEYPATAAWVASCYHFPGQVSIDLSCINEVIEGHGIEGLSQPDARSPDLEYVNMGDTYATTIAYDYRLGRFIVTSYGDWVERQERRGVHYA